MPTPQVASLPWNPTEIRTLVAKCSFTWRERCLIEALLMLARRDGRVFEGNERLADEVSRVGHTVAAEMGLSRRRFPRIDRAYLVRLLAHLRRRGLVDHFWPRLSPTRRWFRVLRLRIEGFRACAAWGEAWRRRWRSNGDPTPSSAPLPRFYSWRMRRIGNRGSEHALVAKVWRNQNGAEWETETERDGGRR